MPEKIPGPSKRIESASSAEKSHGDETIKLRLTLAKELSESQESFPFPGIDPVALAKMQADDIEFPGYTTPVDTLLDRCRSEGIKVIFGKHPESGNVYIVPAGEGDPPNEDDMYLFPRHLQENEMMDGTLRGLIVTDRIVSKTS
jgi:hypothetical protein